MFQPEKNEYYTFEALKAAYGLHRSYAFKNKRNEITAFVLNKEMNPSVENYLKVDELNVLVAEGKNQRESNIKRLLKNREYPVFIKEASNEWLYIGTYFYTKQITNRLEIVPLLKDATIQLAEIVCVLRLSKTSNAQQAKLKLAA